MNARKVFALMNIFFSCVADNISFDLADRLIKWYNPEKCYINYFEGYPTYKMDSNEKNCYYFNHDKCKQADYSGCIFENECLPLDTSTLSGMTEFEPMILKMIERQDTLFRKPYSHESMVRRYHLHLRYWNYMLDAAKIEVAIFTNVPHETFDYLIYCLCKKKGIAVAFPYFIPLEPYGVFANDIENQGIEVLERYQQLSQQFQDTPIEEIELPPDFQKLFNLQSNKNSDKTPYYMKPVKSSAKLKSLAKRVFDFPKKLQYKGIGHLKLVFAGLIIQYKWNWHKRDRKLLRSYEKLSSPVDFSKPYIYLPLHYQPEQTSCPMGGVFVHQLLIAQMLSYYLPEGVQIYVKEHPNQTARCREVQFYKDLVSIPNVKLVHRSTDTYKLMENCIAVASCTGTAGFEGMFIGKPFLMFGSFINMYAPGAFVIRDNENCKQALNYIFQYGAKHTLKDMKVYLKALSEISSPCMNFNLERPWSYFNEDDIRYLENGLVRVIDAQLSCPPHHNDCNDGARLE